MVLHTTKTPPHAKRLVHRISHHEERIVRTTEMHARNWNDQRTAPRRRARARSQRRMSARRNHPGKGLEVSRCVRLQWPRDPRHQDAANAHPLRANAQTAHHSSEHRTAHAHSRLRPVTSSVVARRATPRRKRKGAYIRTHAKAHKGNHGATDAHTAASYEAAVLLTTRPAGEPASPCRQ
jgi:hypothetical protein